MHAVSHKVPLGTKIGRPVISKEDAQVQPLLCLFLQERAPHNWNSLEVEFLISSVRLQGLPSNCWDEVGRAANS